ncbi:hypothetical protein [Hydrogenophaga sp.]|uniref:hypothetical protein n=1 Tax=Hydrogenophaga sp. TaxID=1904254 RepID=UPI002730353B|nr:hypothetical protein [Hydrogenophaga sp.]MDP1686878.1 hypothetical protein [Hydrogenophaga sp.]
MTIKYTEKGPGLHVAIQAAGYSLSQVDGVWTSRNDKAVQALIDGYTVGEARALRKTEISAHATALRNRVIAGYSAGELASWSLKLGEARAFEASSSAATPILSVESSMRGVSLESLVQRVLQNGMMFSMAEAAIAGCEGFHRDALDRCATFEEVAAYDFTAGWPKV